MVEVGGLGAVAADARARQDGSGDRFDLPTGTIYPALHRLEGSGLVKSTWSVVSGRRRRSYELTAAGRKALADERHTWREFAAGVSALLESPCPATP